MPRSGVPLNLRVTPQLKGWVEEYADDVGLTINTAAIMLMIAGMNRPDASAVTTAAPGRPPRRRGTRLPEDFTVTSTMVEWARANAPDVDGRYETEQFCDYWWSKAGQNATKLDWVRTWQVWMRRQQQQAGHQLKGRRRVATSSVATAEADEMLDNLIVEAFGSNDQLALPGGS